MSLKKAISERVTRALERQPVLLAEANGILQVDKSFPLLNSSVAPGGGRVSPYGHVSKEKPFNIFFNNLAYL